MIRSDATLTAPSAARAAQPSSVRSFYSLATLFLLVLTITGFQRFYFHGQAYPGRPLTPPIRSLIIGHGVAMSLWVLVSLAQPLLVASGRRRLHMALGRVSAIFALGLVGIGVKLGIESARVAPPELMHGPLNPRQFMAIPVLSAVLFGLFVAVGVWQRKQPQIHRPLMFLATLSAVGAAIARIDFLNHLYAGTIFQMLFGDFFATVVIGALLLMAKCVADRKFDRAFAAGYAFLVLWLFMTAQIAATPLWGHIASLLLR